MTLSSYVFIDSVILLLITVLLPMGSVPLNETVLVLLVEIVNTFIF
jgi:fumarate reductase subunit D